MSLRQVHKFEFICDGYRPDGKPCRVVFKTEQYGKCEAEIIAHDDGWRQDHRGWICGAPGGHRDDRQAKSERRRYVQWAINVLDRDQIEVVRRESGVITSIATAATMRDADIACRVDRAQVLTDPRVVEISSPERNVR